MSNLLNLTQAFTSTLIFILATVISLKFIKISRIFLFLSIISLGALLYLNSNIFPNAHIKYFLGENRISSEIIGIIKSPAETRRVYFGKVGSRYLFQIESIDGLKITGLVLINIKTEKDYQYGDRLLVKGTIKKPPADVIARALRFAQRKLRTEAISEIASSSAKKHGGLLAMTKRKDFNYREYLERQNIFAIISASEKNITLLSHNYNSNPVIRYAYLIRDKIKNQFLEKMPLESGAFLRAILLGDRSELPKKLNESFRNSGTMHILAISGLHVALIAAAFLYFFKLIRLKRKISYALTMLFLVFLMLLTGSSASVVRATVMCIVFLTGILLGRQVDGYNSLGAAALFILIVNPKDIFNIGFQLSFIAVLSMIYLTPKFMLFVKKEWNFYLRKYLLEPFSVSVSATLGTFPFILYYFRMATPIAIISNIFIVPLMFVLMIGGMCFIVFGWIPFMGGFISYFNNALANIIFFLAEFFAGVKFGHFSI
ncbi:MAG: ComEC family competence protein [Candidatus Omnitrophica bacterium]|nr:ComEC family competence protein [Candidatus Omnitrophota bacterium]